MSSTERDTVQALRAALTQNERLSLLKDEQAWLFISIVTLRLLLKARASLVCFRFLQCHWDSRCRW